MATLINPSGICCKVVALAIQAMLDSPVPLASRRSRPTWKRLTTKPAAIGRYSHRMRRRAGCRQFGVKRQYTTPLRRHLYRHHRICALLPSSKPTTRL